MQLIIKGKCKIVWLLEKENGLQETKPSWLIESMFYKWL